MATAAHLPPRAAPLFTCTPRTTWGIHPALQNETCPHCGWSRLEERRGTEAGGKHLS